MEKLKLLELFGGIGACSKALERLGIDYEIADYVEIDKYAVKSYNAINGTKFEPQDITKWDKDIDVDLIMHGSPCQDFSVAGLGKGGDEGSGTRSSLMYETVRIVEKLKPKYVIWENVKNIISKKHKHNFDIYIYRMKQLGYTNYYQVLNAKDYGIPQNRERVFTISIRNDIKTDFVFPSKEPLTLKLKDILEEIVDEKYYLSDKAIEGRLTTNYQQYKLEDNIINDKELHPTILARFEGAPTLVREDVIGTYRFSKSDSFMKGQNRFKEGKDISVTLQTSSKEAVVLSGAYGRDFGSKGKVQDKEYCDTLTASMGEGGGNVPILKIKNATKQGYLEATEGDGVDISSRMQYHRGNVQSESIQTLTCSGGNDRGVVLKDFANNLRIRKLTPKECWRLMGFDDEDFEKAEKVNSNTQLYKQAGNSIVVNVLEAIFKNLLRDTPTPKIEELLKGL